MLFESCVMGKLRRSWLRLIFSSHLISPQNNIGSFHSLGFILYINAKSKFNTRLMFCIFLLCSYIITLLNPSMTPFNYKYKSELTFKEVIKLRYFPSKIVMLCINGLICLHHYFQPPTTIPTIIGEDFSLRLLSLPKYLPASSPILLPPFPKTPHSLHIPFPDTSPMHSPQNYS